VEANRSIKLRSIYFGNVRNITKGNLLKPKSVPKKNNYVCYEVYIANEKGGKQNHHKIHQLVAKAFIPNPNNYTEIDHIDRNTANNRVENLRWVNRSENCRNMKMRTDNTSGHRGVFFSSQKQKWVVSFEINKKKHYGGSFNSIEEAVACRDKIFAEIL